MKWKDIKNAFCEHQQLSSEGSSIKMSSRNIFSINSLLLEQMLFLQPYIKTSTNIQEIKSSTVIENAASGATDIGENSTNELNSSTDSYNVIVLDNDDDSSTTQNPTPVGEYVNESNVTPTHTPNKNILRVFESNSMSAPKPVKPILARKALIITRKKVLNQNDIFTDKVLLDKKNQQLSTIGDSMDTNLKKQTRYNKIQDTNKQNREIVEKENENPDEYGHGTFLSSFAPVLYSMPLQEAMQVRSQISAIISSHFK
ncbi:hypothetical protein LSTR_LSTR014978 [Laodelphax striatellus]|uniref:BESS domain-containing protein n=2 Tax=Laodelphax striatellus TaxID=195883 RepID=A0A482XSQ3_LAOST|nr:hypothetical protein LSTR_LSTR014978 [Laodelphax striatellus]